MAIRKSSKATRRSAPKLKMSRPKGRAPRGMTVQEAGRLGGRTGGRKGGLLVKAARGIEFFQSIGRLGGARVRELIAAGRKATERVKARASGTISNRPGGA